MATTINAGRVRFVSRGTYNNSTQYYLFDLVDYNGSSYIAKENSLGNLPTNTQYWQLIAEKGNTGNDGQTGPVGPTGNGIASITKTGTSGLIDTYTITYTNGNTTTFTVTNGEDGEVTETELEELRQQIKDLEANQITNEPETATELYLNDSADARFRKLIPIGRTTQDGTPTPENPIPIKNTGDNGTINEKVQNKNLYNEENILLPTGTYTKNNDELIINNGTRDFYKIDFKENTSYTISYDIKTTGSGNGRLEFYYTDGTTESCGTNNTTTYINTAKTSNGNKTLEKIRTTYGSSGDFYLKNIQIEQGSTATDYIAHEEQNISFPLAQGQKLMEGDYLADDGVHHKMGEVVLDGSDDESWELNGVHQGYKLTINNIGGNTSQMLVSNILCNKLKAVSQSDIFNGNVNNGIASLGGVAIYIRINETITTIALLRTYLSNNNLIVQYELSEEVIDPYTEEQQTAWEQIKALRTYKPVTHISSEDETPANLEAEYVVDLKSYIDNK